jgi:hypothetical protein
VHGQIIIAIGGALLAAVDQHSGLAEAMATWNADFVAALATVFQAETSADTTAVRQVAVGVAAIYANVELLAGIDPEGEIRRESLGAALRLAATLVGLNG